MPPKKKPDPTPPSSPALHRVRVELDDIEHVHLRVAAARAKLSMSQLARQVLREYVMENGK